MNRVQLFGLLTCLVATACSGPADEAGGDDESALRGGRYGIELEDESGDLKVRIRYESDRTAGMSSLDRLAYVSRGSEKFSAHCSAAGVLNAREDSTWFSCRKFTSAVTDTQSLDFRIFQKDGAFSLDEVKLRGNQLTTERDLLKGGASGAVALRVVRQSTDVKQNPFAAIARAGDALRPLIGERAYSQRESVDLPVKGFDYHLNEYLGVTAYLKFGRDTDGYLDFALVEDDFNTSSKLLSEAKLAKAARDALPTAPRCTDSGPAATPELAILNAISPLGGPSFGLATEIELSAVPATIRRKMEASAREIRGRSFDGTDYSADVNGYYAVHKSCSDDTVVGYAVWGGGSGEPDYHDGIVIGFDTAGTLVANEEDSG